MRIFVADCGAALLMCAGIALYTCICLFDLVTGGRLSSRDRRRQF